MERGHKKLREPKSMGNKFASDVKNNFVAVIIIVVFVFAGTITIIGVTSAMFVRLDNFITQETANHTIELLVKDINSLNFVLAVEQLESAAYASMISQFNTSMFANFNSTRGDHFNGTELRERFVAAGAQVTAHVVVLYADIVALCATLPTALAATCAPVDACTYTLPTTFTTVPQAIGYVRDLLAIAETAYIETIDDIHSHTSRVLVAGLLAVAAENTGAWRLAIGDAISPVGIVLPRTRNQALCTLGSVYVTDETTCAPYSSAQYC